MKVEKLDHVDDVPVVYFIRVGGGKIKIGYTGYLMHRIPRFEKGNGHQLEVVAAFIGGKDLEGFFHALFKECRVKRRVKGELFEEGPVLEWLRCHVITMDFASREVTTKRPTRKTSLRKTCLAIIDREVTNGPREEAELNRILREELGHPTIDISTYVSRAAKKSIKEAGLVRDNAHRPVIWRKGR